MPNELALRFNAEGVVHGTSNPFACSEVALGRLDRNVPKQKLNLFQFAARSTTKPRACPPKVVRREPLNTRFASVLTHHVPDRLLRQTAAPSAPVLVYPPEQFAGTQVGSRSHSSIEASTQLGIGTVLVWPAFPFKSTMAQGLLAATRRMPAGGLD